MFLSLCFGVEWEDRGVRCLCQTLPPLTHQHHVMILSNVLQLQGHSVDFSSGTDLKDRGDEQGQLVPGGKQL